LKIDTTHPFTFGECIVQVRLRMSKSLMDLSNFSLKSLLKTSVK